MRKRGVYYDTMERLCALLVSATVPLGLFVEGWGFSTKVNTKYQSLTFLEHG